MVVCVPHGAAAALLWYYEGDPPLSSSSSFGRRLLQWLVTFNWQVTLGDIR